MGITPTQRNAIVEAHATRGHIAATRPASPDRPVRPRLRRGRAGPRTTFREGRTLTVMTEPDDMLDGDRLLTPSEVGAIFRVDPKTVSRWAKAGKFTRYKTAGGHTRLSEAEVRTMLGRPVNEPLTPPVEQ